MRDLLALESTPTTLLPQDDKSDGFDNIATRCRSRRRSSSNTSPPRARSRIERSATRSAPGSQTYKTRSQASGSARRSARAASTTSTACRSARAAASSSNTSSRPTASTSSTSPTWSAHSGSTTSEFENTLVVTLDGMQVLRDDVIGGEDDRKPSTRSRIRAVEAINARLKNIRFAATAGPHKVAVTFLRRTFAESDDRCTARAAAAARTACCASTRSRSRGPFNPTGVSATPSRDKIFGCYPRTADEEQPCAEESWRARARAPSVGRSPRRTSQSAAGVLPRRPRDGGVRGGHSQRAHRHPREPVLPLSHRACARRRRGRRRIASRSRARFAAVVLPVEHACPTTSCSTSPRASELRDERVLRSAGRAHARGPARGDAGRELRLPVAATSSKLDEIEPDRGAVPVRRRGAAIRARTSVKELELFVDSIFHEDRSVARSADGRPHVPERAPRAALRHQRRPGRPLPPRRARRTRRAGACSARAPC